VEPDGMVFDPATVKTERIKPLLRGER